MSAHAYFSLMILPPGGVTHETSGALAEQYRPFQVKGTKPLASAHGFSRSDWFVRACAALLDAFQAPQSLRFLSRQSYTHEAFIPYVPDDPDLGGEQMFYTLLEEHDAIRAQQALGALLEACEHRPSVVAQVLAFEFHEPWTTEDVTEEWSRARVCETLNDEADDGDSLLFLFSALTSLHELLRLVSEENVGVYVNSEVM